MAPFPVDLHAHTTASDGSFTPTQLVQRAAARAVKILGIADHDTLDGIGEAQQAGRELNVEIVPAIEFSTRHERDKHFMGIHLLGYFIDPTHPGLVQVVARVKEGRVSQKIEQIKLLQSFGFEIDVGTVFERVNGVPGRPHIAAILMEQNPGRFSSIQQVFDEYLGTGKKAHIKRPFSLTVNQAAAIIREAGGVPVFAHPAAYDADIDPLVAVQNAMTEGVAGVEVYYPYQVSHRSNSGSHWIRRLEELAGRLGLLVTGGSDFHGRPENPVDLGDMGLTEEQFENFKAGWQQIRRN